MLSKNFIVFKIHYDAVANKPLSLTTSSRQNYSFFYKEYKYTKSL